MHLAGFARFDMMPIRVRLRLAHQMMMHGAVASSELSGTRSAPIARSDSTTRLIAVVDRRFGLGADAVERRAAARRRLRCAAR